MSYIKAPMKITPTTMRVLGAKTVEGFCCGRRGAFGIASFDGRVALRWRTEAWRLCCTVVPGHFGREMEARGWSMRIKGVDEAIEGGTGLERRYYSISCASIMLQLVEFKISQSGKKRTTFWSMRNISKISFDRAFHSSS